MLVLFTDFGWQDPYVGQVKAVLAALAPGVPVIDLLHDSPDFNAHAGAHLIAALAPSFAADSVYLCVIDPGVGGPRPAMVMEADGRWYVGPDNGLLSVVGARAGNARYWHITWRPEHLSASFHGRDLFAPIAAELAAGRFPEDRFEPIAQPEARFDPADLPRVIYIDHYGNAWTGIRAGMLADVREIEVRGHSLSRRQSFHEVVKGEAFWFENSVGLVEVAVNRGSAARQLGLAVGDVIKVAGAPAGLTH